MSIKERITAFARRFSSNDISTDQFDYIVVGAGSAGCVVANRLVLNDANTRVLVTEAGSATADQSWKVRMPAALSLVIGNKNFDWCFFTTPQPHMNGREIFFSRGKSLGGSSLINAMIYIRGNAADYDRWAFTEGATGWSYADCLPYFIKSQKHELGANEYRGDSGILHVSPSRSTNPLYDVFVAAGHQLGHPITKDFNGAQQEGFGKYDFTIVNGQRASTAVEYLRPAMKEAGSRLTVSTSTLVHRVLFNGRRAVGIEYQTGGKETPVKRAYASKEIILCGGAVNSPQLLMLSGIGPADELRRHNIELVHNSPGVGRNLQDHVCFNVQYRCTKPVTLYRNQYPHRAIKLGLQWLLNSSGSFANSDLAGGGFVRSRPDIAQPNIQFHFAPALFFAGNKIPYYDGFQIVCNTLRPTSRGSITLRSADPYDSPVIDPNYLDTKEDVEDLRATCRIIRQVIAQPAFDQYRGDEITPGSACQSDSEIDTFVRENSGTAYHACGTCRMGSANNDDMVVVDTNCRVIGVEGLRVVDASVMPSVVSGNTNGPVIMIAEKCSDMILGKPPLPKALVQQQSTGQ